MPLVFETRIPVCLFRISILSPCFLSQKVELCIGLQSGSFLTRTRASVRLVHMAISSLVDMSGYLFLAKFASSSCSCCDVKCVLCLRGRFPCCPAALLLPAAADDDDAPAEPPVVADDEPEVGVATVAEPADAPLPCPEPEFLVELDEEPFEVEFWRMDEDEADDDVLW